MSIVKLKIQNEILHFKSICDSYAKETYIVQVKIIKLFYFSENIVHKKIVEHSNSPEKTNPRGSVRNQTVADEPSLHKIIPKGKEVSEYL